MSKPRIAIVQNDPPRGGFENMAIDDHLLASCQENSPVVLRIYRWSEPTLSLGHFQKDISLSEDSPWSSIPRVVRKTGGGAIVHDRELTYSFVLPTEAGSPKGAREDLYRSVHNGFVRGLQELGWDATLSETCTCKVKSEGESQEILCFMRRSPVDVVVGLHKIIGSAQRRGSRGILQHGSFLLSRSTSAPELPGLLNIARRKRQKDPTNYNGSDEELTPDVPQTDIDWTFWEEWMTRILKESIASVLPCTWQTGNLNNSSSLNTPC